MLLKRKTYKVQALKFVVYLHFFFDLLVTIWKLIFQMDISL